MKLEDLTSPEMLQSMKDRQAELNRVIASAEVSIRALSDRQKWASKEHALLSRMIEEAEEFISQEAFSAA